MSDLWLGGVSKLPLMTVFSYMKQQYIRFPITNLLFLIICLFSLSYSSVVFACECPKRNDFQREFEQSQSVFVGEVVEINNSLTDTHITFNVERIWKGTKSESIVVRTRN